ncbi:GNAT family N-acetyltransferase [Veronia pacifica]|uniref:Acetyltransferase n=1 Tax=Veronia pacifica TaxID=1080227 RepID=A0A1C3ECH5_9GAMM|nr:GNAT family protein [Veronia pacifica]ODA30910.1 acetyltransferase [Veronia pacifica]
MVKKEKVTIRPAHTSEARAVYDLLTTDEKWTEFNGPYLGYERPEFDPWRNDWFKSMCEGRRVRAIDFQGRIVGAVSWYWECEETRWLEAGIVIYDSGLWSKGIGRQALVDWVSHIFDGEEVARVGLTTWSGNPRMIKSAQAIGFTIEGVIRKVRYYRGEYYDSVKLGVLKEEWQSLCQNQ